MAAVEVVLIAVNQQDIASTNQAVRLRELDAWTKGPLFEDLMTFSLQHLRMVYLPNGLLFEDHLDRRWFTSTGERVTEVIFPSRHAAASGQASLTLHPIGVPHLDEGSVGPYGGFGGSAPPPSTRLAPWWRLLLERATDHADVEGFDLSLEVTHHGPYLETPCLFIEVGSTEATWGHTGAANLLAEIIRDGLLNQTLNIPWNEDEHAGQLVLITLGGGHYAPRANALASIEGVWLGHMLATYALPFTRDGEDVGGAWKQSMKAAIASTRQSFPGGQVVCSMDKKAFKGWQRQAIRAYLEDQNIPLLTRKQFQERMNNR